jgi:hypothetical protein
VGGGSAPSFFAAGSQPGHKKKKLPNSTPNRIGKRRQTRFTLRELWQKWAMQVLNLRPAACRSVSDRTRIRVDSLPTPVICSLIANSDRMRSYPTEEQTRDRKTVANGSQPGQQTGQKFDP